MASDTGTSGSWTAGAVRSPRRERPESGGMGAGRVPPSNIDAEKSVLSSILLDNTALTTAVELIRSDDFYHPAHELIYEAMVTLNEESRPVDLLVLADYLKSHELLERVGGVEYVAGLADWESTSANVEFYAKIVRDKSIKRSLIHVASDILAQGYEDQEEAGPMLDSAGERMFELGELRSSATLQPLNKEMHETTDFLEMLMGRSGELTGLPTGFQELDKKTGGLQPGDLIILAARPSMGKTALALNMARNAAVDHGKKVAVFSLEMTSRSLVLRMLASEAQVDASVFRSGMMGHDVFNRLIDAAGRLAEESVWLDDSSVASVREIRAKSRRLHHREGLDLVIVDYLQLAHADGRVDSREQEISAISRGLKSLAKELNVPVIALSQLNRGPESRGAEDKRPMLSDLRESGAIEQDADVIAFIYRDVVYNRDTEFEDLAELIIAKQRNGPTGVVKMQFNSRFAQFTDWNRDDPYDGAPMGAPAAPARFDQEF